jgi:hypothetical protein
MKKYAIFFILFLIFGCSSNAKRSADGKAGSADEKLIQAVTEEYAAALTDRDVSVIERIFADEGSFSTYVGGVLKPVSKRMYLEIMPTKFAAWDAGGYAFKNTLEDLSIEGERATGTITVSYTSSAYSGADEFEVTFAKRGAVWVLVEVLPR